MKRNGLTAAMLIASASLLLTGCSGADDAPGGDASPIGAWGAEDGPHLTLEEGGGLTGHDGCNNLSGSWELEGEKVDFGDVAMTLMACEGVDTWLSGLASATVDGDTLRIFDEVDAEIGSLDRQ